MAEPKKDDAVLGGENLAQTTNAVLGGHQGAVNRLLFDKSLTLKDKFNLIEKIACSRPSEAFYYLLDILNELHARQELDSVLTEFFDCVLRAFAPISLSDSKKYIYMMWDLMWELPQEIQMWEKFNSYRESIGILPIDCPETVKVARIQPLKSPTTLIEKYLPLANVASLSTDFKLI